MCAYRKAHAVVKGIASTLGNLLMVVLRPVLLGVITFCEDLISPFTRMASGIRHIRELPQELSDAGSDQIRAAKKAYVRSGIRKYYTLLWNAITYVLPAIAAAVLVVVVRNGLGLRFVLNVQVNGESVGYVAASKFLKTPARMCSPVSTRPSLCWKKPVPLCRIPNGKFLLPTAWQFP